MSTKGSWNRVTDQKAYDANWDKIFSPPKKEEEQVDWVNEQLEEEDTTDEV